MSDEGDIGVRDAVAVFVLTMLKLADAISVQEKYVRLAERSLEAGVFELPAEDGRIVVLVADVADTAPILREVATMPIEAAASISELDADELREQSRADRGLLVVVVLRGPKEGQRFAATVALHRPWTDNQSHRG